MTTYKLEDDFIAHVVDGGESSTVEIVKDGVVYACFCVPSESLEDILEIQEELTDTKAVEE